jgi:cell wall-associated NlpC family hydrolase
MRLGRTVGRPLALVAGSTLTLALAVADAGSAGANPPGPHDPLGAVSSVKAAAGGVTFTGWATDPDAPTANANVYVLQDGSTRIGTVTTSVASPTVQTKYGTGPTPGFTLTVAVDALPHTLCVVAANVARGLPTVLKCVPTPLGTTLTSAQLRTHNPVGAVTQASATSTSLRLQGWSSDPDDVGRRATVVLYVDGAPAATALTDAYAAPRPTGAGSMSAFDITVPVTKGMHLGCIWVVNVGLGSGNSFLGCRAKDTRGGAGTGTVTVPKLNTQVVTEAKRHIGQAYVWGAAGPRTFDCSGLVKFSYGKFGFTTPRVSEDQALAARLIPPARAVPGDLVFTHDTEGDVYHVAIYLSPGLTVAAIDESQGVDYQKIWDPKSVSYGSFTHT